MGRLDEVRAKSTYDFGVGKVRMDCFLAEVLVTFAVHVACFIVTNGSLRMQSGFYRPLRFFPNESLRLLSSDQSYANQRY